MKVLVQDLLMRPPANVAALVRVLNHRLECTVITPAENQKLTAAGMSWKTPEGATDGWERYQVAGIDVSGFAPLHG